MHEGTIFIFWVIKNIIIIIFPILSVLNVRTSCSLCSLTFPNPSAVPAALITETGAATLLSHTALSTYLKQWANCKCDELLCLLMCWKTTCVCVCDIISPKLWGGLEARRCHTSWMHSRFFLIERHFLSEVCCAQTFTTVYFFGLSNQNNQTFTAPAHGHQQKQQTQIQIDEATQSCVLIGTRAHTQRTFGFSSIKWIESKLHCIRAQSSHFEGWGETSWRFVL